MLVYLAIRLCREVVLAHQLYLALQQPCLVRVIATGPYVAVYFGQHLVYGQQPLVGLFDELPHGAVGQIVAVGTVGGYALQLLHDGLLALHGEPLVVE